MIELVLLIPVKLLNFQGTSYVRFGISAFFSLLSFFQIRLRNFYYHGCPSSALSVFVHVALYLYQVKEKISVLTLYFYLFSE